jgi:hypothetical protein
LRGIVDAAGMLTSSGQASSSNNIDCPRSHAVRFCGMTARVAGAPSAQSDARADTNSVPALGRWLAVLSRRASRPRLKTVMLLRRAGSSPSPSPDPVVAPGERSAFA